MEVGAVASMQFVKGAIRAAKLVSEYTQHTLLVGNRASTFALSMGLPGPTNLSSPESLEKWAKWKQNNCEPNFRKNVIPVNGCGPYRPVIGVSDLQKNYYACDNKETIDRGSILANANTGSEHISRHNHDTISMAVIDKLGHIAVGTSTNGATFKIPGRVGDGPIAGSSAYADQEAGACGATGDGDVMMRFLPCYQVVESMRQGMTPKDAAVDAISRIKRKYPDFVGALFALNVQGVHSGACHGWTFQYSVRSEGMEDVEVYTVHPEDN
ncbi:probable isoaspartyl peptidase/L-asparaginase 3 isoform X2 [Cryptomeria japonica]|nr:probable isoaspartyl peptidase/L-asparaginase 3 isoform X2 [Cryptomeria japonica]